MSAPVKAAPGLSREQAAQILKRAASLRERQAALAGCRAAPHPEPQSPEESYRHQAWEAMVSMGTDAAGLARIYGAPEARRRLFSQAALDAVAPERAQIIALQQLFARMVDPQASAPFLHSGRAPLPFEDLFYGPVSAALMDLRTRLDGAEGVDPLAETVWADLAQHLLGRLSHLAAESLYRQFSVWRRRAQADAAGADPGPDLYRDFIATERAPTVGALFTNFPVLPRLLLCAIAQWDQAMGEMLTRLATDRSVISARFDLDPAGLTRVLPLGSDPHNDGRIGFQLRLKGGGRLAYKPRSLGMEQGWEELIAWLGAQGLKHLPKAARVLDRQSYGWMEWLAPETEPQAEADPESFAASLGSLLCLAHLLNGTDLHFENLLAVGDQVAAVDLETLLHPRAPMRGEAALLAAGFDSPQDGIRRTVMWTHLLPSWVTIRNRDDIGMGGSNAADAQERETPTLVEVNSARMGLKQIPRKEAARANLPPSLQDPARLAALAPRILASFNATWQALDRLRPGEDALPARVADLFGRGRTRVILRPTQVYFLILRRALSAEMLVDGAAWSGQFDFLLRFVEPAGLAPWQEAILAAEAGALARLDIPFFQADVAGRTLIGDGGLECPGAYDRSPLADVTAGICALDPSDRQRQSMLIDASLAALDPGALTRAAAVAPGAETAAAPLDEAALIEAAAEIGQALLAGSVDGAGGGWLSLVPSRGYRFVQLEMIRPDLYSGQLGIAMFLAALAKVTGAQTWQQGARQATARLRRALEVPALVERTLLVHGAGLGAGLGGWVYGFLWLYEMGGDEADLARARRAGRALAAAPGDGMNSDLLDGAAGAILALVKLEATIAEPWVGAAARAYGDLLLAQAATGEGGALVWPSLRDEALAGMAHGAAGIALALGMLGARSGEERFHDAARRALRFERGIFDAARQGWPDLRSGAPGGAPGRPPLLNRWCHGATGIGLSRLRLRDLLPDPEIDGEIELAITATGPALDGGLDSLCCGNFGRIEFLHSAGAQLDRPDLIAAAREAAQARIAQRRRVGAFRWPGGDDSLNVGLFTGTAGIGLEVLRLARPEQIPCLLQWR